MSYCRWSSDNWRCDVYCYESVDDTFTTHVAGNRVVGEIPPEPDWELILSDPDEWRRQHEKVTAFLHDAKREPIGLPYDGESFYDGSLEEFLQTLTMLREAGYNVPQHVFDTVREEIADAQG